jgi:hypothetical protein
MALPNRPCGTPEEVEAIGINPETIPTCAPNVGTKFPGCQMWRFCKCADRNGALIKGKTGPAYYGVKIAKPVAGRGVGKSQEVMACHVYVQLRQQIRANGGICQIVAFEGDELEVRGSKKMAPKVSEGEEPGPWKWETMTYKVKVPVYPRPKDIPELLDIAFLAQAQQEEEDAAEQRESRVLGKATEHKDATGQAIRK